MTDKEKELISAFARNNMNIAHTARELSRTVSAVRHQLKKINSRYKLDPKCFHDLTLLLARLDDNNERMSARIFYCPGVAISWQTADTIAEHLYKAGYRKI